MIVLKILGIIAIVFAVLFLLSLVVYFFNLDMKFSSKVAPLFFKYFDKKPRDKKL